MGRKSEKSKLRTAQKKIEKIRYAEGLESVKKANELINPLDDFPVFQTFQKNGLKYKIEYKAVKDLDKETIDWVFDLEKANMEEFYNACDWGWKDDKKLKEMTEESAKYLIVRDENQKPVAFTHFRFDMDYGCEVLYCYELQLHPSVQRKGLGKFLLQVLELIAFKNSMRKVVLTVLKHNVGAVEFFYSMRYTPDDTNLSENLFEKIPYEILSKVNKKLPPHDFNENNSETAAST